MRLRALLGGDTAGDLASSLAESGWRGKSVASVLAAACDHVPPGMRAWVVDAEVGMGQRACLR